MRRNDRAGQVAVVDAILFMTIMLIASAVVGGLNRPVEADGIAFRGLQAYTEDYASALLALELADVEYFDSGGSRVMLGVRNIGQLLCDESMVLCSAPDCDFSAYNEVIWGAASGLVRPGLDCAVRCGDVLISGANGVPPEHCASLVQIFPAGEYEEAVVITVYVWVV